MFNVHGPKNKNKKWIKKMKNESKKTNLENNIH